MSHSSPKKGILRKTAGEAQASLPIATLASRPESRLAFGVGGWWAFKEARKRAAYGRCQCLRHFFGVVLEVF